MHSTRRGDTVLPPTMSNPNCAVSLSTVAIPSRGIGALSHWFNTSLSDVHQWEAGFCFSLDIRQGLTSAPNRGSADRPVYDILVLKKRLHPSRFTTAADVIN